MANIKEIVVKNPNDARRETSVPPEAAASAEVVELPPMATDLATALADEARVENAGATEAPARALSFAPSDPRLVELERAASLGDWTVALRLADTVEDAAKLPPAIALVWALARKETLPPDDKGGNAVTALAVRSAATLLGVGDKSDLALLIAKRLLRKNPASWAKKPAPSTGISILIMVLALIVGSGIGLLFSGVPLRLDFLH